MREAQNEMTMKWTFKGVSRVAGTEPVEAKPQAPVLRFGKKP